MSKTIHIVPGYSAAASLRQALHLGKEDVLAFEDSLDGGPTLDFQSTREWTTIRKAYWDGFINDQGYVFPKLLAHVYNETVDCLPLLSAAEEIILWVGGDVREQLYLLWVFRLFECYGLDFSKLKLIEAYKTESHIITGIGVYNPEQLKTFYEGNHRSLKTKDLAGLKRAWNAVTSFTPDALQECCSTGIDSFPRLTVALTQFMTRYPDTKTGLNLHQRCLLEQAKQGPKAARILGYALGKMDQYGIDFVGDLYLFELMKRLGDPELPHPALTVTGNLSNLRETEAHLTDMGEKFLAGKANFAEVNGLDYWVGAVHLTPENLWYYDNGKLIKA